MNAAQRRECILTRLSGAQNPVSASALAAELGVSRQIVVGDVALLRAGGAQIDGIDYQILIESDYIVNASESGYDQQAIRTFMEHTMKTAAGIRLTKTVFGV